MVERPETGPLIRPSAPPKDAEPGVRTLCRVTGSQAAQDVALHLAGDGGSVLFVRDVEVPDQTPLSLWGDAHDEEALISRELDRLVERARTHGIDADAVLRVSHDAQGALKGTVEDHAASIVVLEAEPTEDRVPTIDPRQLSRDAGIPVVEMHAVEDRFEPGSILVPFAGGPAGTLALRTAAVLAERTDASLELMHVLDFRSTRKQLDAWEDRLSSHLSLFGEDVDARVLVGRSRDVPEAVRERAAYHDALVLGGTRKGAFKRWLKGTVPDALREDPPVDTLVVHSA